MAKCLPLKKYTSMHNKFVQSCECWDPVKTGTMAQVKVCWDQHILLCGASVLQHLECATVFFTVSAIFVFHKVNYSAKNYNTDST